ncbi:GntR family transcriptional regulator [Xanthobacter pseudotagetidis]|uniref:GntR family transcriptional regulator n=1 Tax=Xanthobacter pseudotagetidis TaxID=3119911 RepID=UPI00372D2687
MDGTRKTGTKVRTVGAPARVENVRAVPASARIHEALREKIIAMEWTPGAAVQEKQIALAYGVSRTPVREAVLKLADERLVDIFPQYGTFVSRISLPSVRDAMVIRQSLERTAVREAALKVAGATEKASKGLLAEIKALVARQRASHKAGDLAAFHAADEAFHQAIAELAGHPNIWRVIRQEKAQVDRCRLLTLPAAERRASVIAEHAAIVDAVAAGDAAAAEAAVAAHLGRVIPSIAGLVAAYPDYFAETEILAEAASEPPSPRIRTL